MPQRPNYKRGDVVLVLFPNSDLRTAKARPAVIVQAGQQSGLLNDSVIVTDNLATILETGVSRVIGSLPMQRIDRALRHTLGL